MPTLVLSRKIKYAIMIAMDIFLVLFSLWLAFALRLSEWFWPYPGQLSIFFFAPILALPIFTKFGFYRVVVRYMGPGTVLTIIKASGVFVLLWLLMGTTLLSVQIGSEFGIPRSIPILFWIILIMTIGGSRLVVRWLLRSATSLQSTRNVLIYGASRLGSELASSLSHDRNVRILGIIDDDHTLHNHYIQNLKVLGDRTRIAKIRASTNSLEVLLTMPKMQSEQRKDLFKYLEDKRVTVKTIPSLAEIASGALTINNLRDIDITDLLARDGVTPKEKLLSACVTGKKVMVTGAGGSIGSELCRQILSSSPTRIVLFEHSEFNLYQINNELTNLCAKKKYDADIIPVLGSINSKQLVEDTIKNFKINTLYHAAAYKHVTLLEHNIAEGIRNNIFGTYNVAQAAIDLNVEHFILISTDKAVRPTSIMGATKRIAELIVQGLSQKKGTEHADRRHLTHFAIIRFGNVLNSSGSVIPLFQQQIASGGPITISHPEATRYFMTIAEASQLVIQAGSLGESCSVFVLDMGEPVSILSMAKQLVYLSGHMLKTKENQSDESGIDIRYTGLQKGEKIHEELFIGENVIRTEHPMIMEVREDFCEWSQIQELLAQLESPNSLGSETMRQRLLKYAMKGRAEKPAQPQ